MPTRSVMELEDALGMAHRTTMVCCGGSARYSEEFPETIDTADARFSC